MPLGADNVPPEIHQYLTVTPVPGMGNLLQASGGTKAQIMLLPLPLMPPRAWRNQVKLTLKAPPWGIALITSKGVMQAAKEEN